MNFDLIRPCPQCPFRTDKGYLRRGRAEEIVNALEQGQTFQCHKTLVHADCENDEPLQTAGDQHCAGALIMMEKADMIPGQLARISQRLGLYDPSKLDLGADVVDDPDQFIEIHDS